MKPARILFSGKRWCLLSAARQTHSSEELLQNKQEAIDARHPQYYEIEKQGNDLCTPFPDSATKWDSAKNAMKVIESWDTVFVQGIAATPTPLLKALCNHVKKADLKNITMLHSHLEGPVIWTTPEFEGKIRSNTLFTGSNMRTAVNNGRADAIPVFMSEIPWLFRRNQLPTDVALIHVSMPDKKGFCSIGVSIDISRAAILNAKYIIAMANPNMPRTFGDGMIHQSHIDAMVFNDTPLHELNVRPSGVESKIGTLIAENLVFDGATLQMGVGAAPDAALAAMKGHKNLGIHTEMFSDGLIDLIRCGAVTNAAKKVCPGKVVSAIIYGSRKLYDFVHDNPMILMGDMAWVNDTTVIRRNPRVTAINSAVEVDLTGQVVSDSIGKKYISGYGGQLDFIHGAALSNDGLGKPIMALPSVTNKGESKIVPYLKDGAGVVTTRAHVHYIVTEFGIASLFGKNMRQRAFELIQIAHPNHRENLEKAAFQRLKCMPSCD